MGGWIYRGPKKLEISSANPGKILAPAENQADGKILPPGEIAPMEILA